MRTTPFCPVWDMPGKGNGGDGARTHDNRNHKTSLVHQPARRGLFFQPLEFSVSSIDGLISLFPDSNQSSPNNSTGCCVRSEPLPQFRESTEQYLSQPQQIRSGCFGFNGNILATLLARIIRNVAALALPLDSLTCLPKASRSAAVFFEAWILLMQRHFVPLLMATWSIALSG